jgi:hypothetical protein
MTQPDTGATGGKTFTQAEVDQIVKDRLTRERAKFADYDELKAKAAEADKSATQLDKIQQQLEAVSQRAEQSERQAMIREVADELKISVKQASRLSGKTKEELLSDGREFLEDFAPKGRTNEGGNDDAGSNSDDSATTSPARETTAPSRGRPKETLRTGAPLTRSEPEETNPLKLAELIPRM